jgi:DNA repair exonuclease SbcCD ATPase subunit
MRLVFDNIRFRNFFSFGSRWQDVEFIPGLNLILGYDVEKDRSNAAGKSSFLETIPFALFGKVNRAVKKEQIVNWKSRKNCEVQLDFKRGDNLYTIYRGIKPDKLIVSKNGRDLPMDSKKLDFQKRFEDEVLGMDFKTFMSIIYTNLNSTAPILTMSKPEKRKFLERVFGLGVFTSVNEEANAKLRTVDKKLYENKAQKENNERIIDDAESQIHDLTRKVRKMETHLPQLIGVREEVERLEEQYHEAEIIFDEKRVELVELTAEVEFLTVIISKISAKKETVKSKIRNLTREIKLIGGEEKDLSRLEELKQALSKIKLDDINRKIDGLESEQDALVDKRLRFLESINYIIAQRTSIESIINQDIDGRKLLEDESRCPTCGQRVGADILDVFLERIDKNKEYIESQNKQLADKNIELQDIDFEIDNLYIELEKWKKAERKYRELESEMNSLLHLRSEQERKQKLEGKLLRSKRALIKLQEVMDKWLLDSDHIEGEIFIINEEMQGAKEAIAEYNSAVKRLENLEELVAFEEQHKKDLEDMIKDYDNKRIQAIADNESIKTERKKFYQLNDYLQFIRKICKDENIKQYAISSNIQYLSKQTNHYLSEVGHGFYILLDKWLDLQIRGPGIAGASYGNLSGGESRGIDLSLQMAILDFARVKAGVFPDILELDELLDSSIDSFGLQKVMEIVKMKQRDDNLKIFLVSHRKEVNDVDVDRTYIVEKIGGYSNIVLQ